MRHNLRIDGIDALTEYGVCVARGGYNSLAEWPVFKDIDAVAWPEGDGCEPDLEEPEFEGREISIDFAVRDVARLKDLYYDLSDGAYHLFEFVELGLTRRLRLLKGQRLTALTRVGAVTLEFADDFPTAPQAEPWGYGEAPVRRQGWEIDGRDLCYYGAKVLKGTMTDWRGCGDVRPNLEVPLSGAGAYTLYDGAEVHYKEKEFTLNLLMRSRTLEAFWKGYNALLTALAGAGEHLLGSPYDSGLYGFYYGDCAVSELVRLADGGIWCEFAVKVVLTGWRPETDYCLLAAEDGVLVATEDGAAFVRVRSAEGLAGRKGLTLLAEDGSAVATEAGEEINVNIKV